MSNPQLPPPTFGDDPLGLDAWANSCVVAPHTAIAVAASILAGVAGPLGRLPAKACVLSPGVNLAGRQDDSFLRMTIDGLVSPLLRFEEALVAMAKEKSPEEVDNAMFFPNRKRVVYCIAPVRNAFEAVPPDPEILRANGMIAAARRKKCKPTQRLGAEFNQSAEFHRRRSMLRKNQFKYRALV